MDVLDPDDRPRRRVPRGRAEWYEHASAASLGIEIAVAISLGAFVGMWVEHRFTHWSPWTTLIGLGFGVGAAALAIVRTIRHDEARRAQRARTGATAEPAAGGPASPAPFAPAERVGSATTKRE